MNHHHGPNLLKTPGLDTVVLIRLSNSFSRALPHSAA